jgi:simple sugar transport system permease protein
MSIETAPPWKRLLAARLFWPMAGLALLLVFNLFFTTNFYHLEIREGHLYGTLTDILNRGSQGMILALGMTLVIATGGVDLSVGSMMAVSGVIGALLVTDAHLPFPLVVALALLGTLAAGLWNGMLVAYFRIQPIVATLILMVAGRGIALLFTDGQIITFTDKSLVYFGNGYLLGIPFTMTIVAVVFLILALLTRKTALGLFIESTGDNETASRFCGLNVQAIKLLAYGFSGICAGVVGLIAASNIKAADSSRVGENMELDAIFAVVVGGTALTGGRFTLVGSIIGAILIQTLTHTMYGLGVPAAVAPVPKAVVVVAVCLLQSETFRMKVQRVFGRLPATSA